MKKVFSFTGIVAYACLTTVFADYPLTTSDKAVVQEVIQKVQSKPSRTQEVVIYALKNAQHKIQYSQHKKAIFAAVESGLRQKTASGDMLATNFEKNEIISSLFDGSDATDTLSATIQVEGDLSSSEEGNLVIRGSLKTDVDVRDATQPKVRLLGDISVSVDEMVLDAAGELRVLDSVGYFLVKKFSLTPDEGMGDTLEPFLNIWWRVPLDESSMQDIETSSEETVNDLETVRSALLKKNVIPKLIYTAGTQGTSIYTGTVDNKVFVDMLSEIAASQGEEFDVVEMKDILEGITLQTYFSLDAQKVLSALSITVSVDKEIDTDTIEGAITFTIDISDTPGSIVAPDNARDMSSAFDTVL